jgi:signal transduction histidine kinase
VQVKGLGTNLQTLGPYFKRQHEQALKIKAKAPKFLPAGAQEKLRRGEPAQGTVSYKGVAEYFAAQPVNPGTLVLLRPQSTAGSLLSPYVWGLLVAAAVGGLLAALAAFLLARRISRPVRRIAAAARTLTGGTHPEPVPVEGAAEIATLAVAFSVRNTEIDLAEVAEDAVRRYEQQAESFGVELDAMGEAPAPAIGDADRVLQVVSNLVENALRLTPPGGEVRVVAAPGVLRVEDTGPGLAETDAERAFERFYLHERYGLERQVGTGLGLAIVKELTLAMGGNVDVESHPGKLTVFTVRLRVPVAARETLPA